MSRRSLDDYAMMVRFGVKYGFDFRGHVFSQMGELRSFVNHVKSILRS
jgi:hypothetical protein